MSELPGKVKTEHTPAGIPVHITVEYSKDDLKQLLSDSDLEPVVRCRDCWKCKIGKAPDGSLKYCCAEISRITASIYLVSPDHFCSHGEKEN